MALYKSVYTYYTYDGGQLLICGTGYYHQLFFTTVNIVYGILRQSASGCRQTLRIPIVAKDAFVRTVGRSLGLLCYLVFTSYVLYYCSTLSHLF